MTFSKMTLSKITMRKMTFSKMTLSKITMRKMTFSKMTVKQTFCKMIYKNDFQLNDSAK
jgi:hypothetical protein